MRKLLLLFFTLITVGYFQWFRLDNKSPSVTSIKVSDENTDEHSRQQNLKNKNLHKAFEKILKREELINRRPSSEEAPHEVLEDNVEEINPEMSADQRRELIITLQHEVIINEKTIASLKAKGEFEVADKLEARLMQKKEQLENLQQMEAQSGEDFETN